MKKSRFTEEQMVAILREADKAPVELRQGVHQIAVRAAFPPEPSPQPRFVDVGQRLIGAEYRLDAARDDSFKTGARFRLQFDFLQS